MTNISIIVPCYNQSEYLAEALQSVLDQSFLDWECIIVNDGSPDDTEKIAQEWLSKDNRFKYISKENGGLCDARNVGISKAGGKYILPLDADDKLGKDYLELAFRELENDTDLQVVYCKAEKFGIENGSWDLPPYSLKALATDNMIFCSAIFRKNEWERVGGYDLKMEYGLEDWEFWIALLKSGGKVIKLDYIGFYYRIKSSSMIQQLNKSNKKKKKFEYISVKHADFMVQQLGSFMHLNHINQSQKIEFENKLKSEKFVLKLFINTILNFFKKK